MKSHPKERRVFFRHPIRVPLELNLGPQKASATPEAMEISLGGLSFLWKDKLLKGDSVTLSIPVKDALFENIKARVVYSREDRKTAYFHTGVFFIDVPSAFKAKLAEEVLEILKYQKTRSRELGRAISENEAADEWIQRFANQFPQLYPAPQRSFR